MRKFLAPAALVLMCVSPAAAADERPDTIVENMSVKLVRGVTNLTTSVVELPKQTILSVKNRGASGYVIGPVKGIGMTLYRALIGTTETIFFMVPAPGHYDPMMEPEFVWQEWR